MKIYCDESGYTGNGLLEQNQPYFVYCGINLTDDFILEICDYIYTNYKIQGNEIKGRNLLQNNKGKKIIECIFEKYSTLARVVFDDKKYVLAAKIVEYAIEPYLKSNELFYTSNLHEFIASGLYASFITYDKSAETLFNDFLAILQGNLLFEKSNLIELSTPNSLIKWVLDIATHDPKKVIYEISEENNNVQKWILDLTITSLYGILSDFSKNGEELEVICDNSKVFNNNELFDTLNRFGLANSRIEFLNTPIGFNLKEVILSENSKKIKGLQIADLFSSTINFCLTNDKEDYSANILDIVYKNCICTPNSFCVLPKINSHKDLFQKNKDFYIRLMRIIQNDVKSSKKSY